MKRFGPAEDDHYAANVWPAVTDTILLMASIFIVLSVVSMSDMAQKLYDYKDPSNGESQVQCAVASLSGDYFNDSEYDFKPSKAATAKAEIKVILRELPDYIGAIRESAETQGWADFYIVIEAGGHADNQPYLDKDGKDQNWFLSTARANTVIHFIERALQNEPELREKLGVTNGKGQPGSGSTVLRAAGYSYYVPRADFKDLKSMQLKAAQDINKRVEIRIFAQPVGTVHMRDPG